MIVFLALRTVGLVRYFEPSLRLLADRGHLVHIGFPYGAKGGDALTEWVRDYALPLAGQPLTADEPEAVEMLADMAERFPNISWGFITQSRTDGWEDVLTGLRAFQDYLRYLEPEYCAVGHHLRDRSIYG